MRAAPFGLLAAMLAAAGISATAEASPRAVVELFTSQGCSSCPPADELLAKLARDPNVIALSLPVDYWDRLGWKDTLARHAFTERQMAYASVRGDGQVYTPQAVVNGREHAVGSERSAIERAAAATAAGLSVPLDVERAATGSSCRSAPRRPGQQRREPSCCLPFSPRARLPSGAARTRAKVTYTNVVRDIVAIADWNGRADARGRCPREHSRTTTASSCCCRRARSPSRAPSSAPRASPCASGSG